MKSPILRLAILATTLFTLPACSCAAHHRVALPTGAAYRQTLDRLRRLDHDVQIEVDLSRLRASSPEARIFRRYGLIRFDAMRAVATSPVGSHSSHSKRDISVETIDITIGRQSIETLTFAGEDEPGCSTYGSAQDAFGYQAHMVTFTNVGRALQRAHLLYIGYQNEPRLWDGYSHDNGIFATFVDDDASTPHVLEEGEAIQLRSFFTERDHILPG